MAIEPPGEDLYDDDVLEQDENDDADDDEEEVRDVKIVWIGPAGPRSRYSRECVIFLAL
jgi:hypothetical protein